VIVQVDAKQLKIVAAIDPAGTNTELRGQASRMAIGCIGADQDGRVFVLDSWAGRVSTEKFIERIFDVAEKYNPQPFGCEANALQQLFKDATNLIARSRGLRLNLRPIKQPQKIDKDTRIRLVLQPVVARGHLFLRADQTRLRDVILAFPQSQFKDEIDVLASAINLLPARLVMKASATLEQALAEYHQRAGTAPSILQYRMQQLKNQRERPTPRLA
jgi:predicted phage terminase large subunit-like protein